MFVWCFCFLWLHIEHLESNVFFFFPGMEVWVPNKLIKRWDDFHHCKQMEAKQQQWIAPSEVISVFEQEMSWSLNISMIWFCTKIPPWSHSSWGFGSLDIINVLQFKRFTPNQCDWRASILSVLRLVWQERRCRGEEASQAFFRWKAKKWRIP